ncbi:hypothetical protein BDN67DRAFT_404580 [Paxillus ammoniavirescens]|nr:hypothetical protein BDN67DRAFT_404580 [Paxillus ammoniavirescens]
MVHMYKSISALSLQITCSTARTRPRTIGLDSGCFVRQRSDTFINTEHSTPATLEYDPQTTYRQSEGSKAVRKILATPHDS